MPYADPERQKEYQRRWVAARRAAWLAKNGPCAFCASWVDLEIDHIDPSIKITHTVWSWSEQRREAELAKCRVLCGPCHKERTRQQLLTAMCSGGHPWTTETTEWNDVAHLVRACKLCRRERHRRNRAKKKHSEVG